MLAKRAVRVRTGSRSSFIFTNLLFGFFVVENPVLHLYVTYMYSTPKNYMNK